MSDTQKIPIILVVDDNPQNLQLIGAMLGESLEFDLSFATGGQEALEAMEHIAPDLVLLDVNMPEMNGFEVCRRIRETEATATIPVIFLTAQGETDFIVQGFRAGGSDYVVKPFEPQELLARVRVQLELYRSRNELKRLNDELLRVNDELRLLSSTDGLLRIANRRHFDERLELEWHRAMRGRQPLALMIIDVDHFKRYNDHYGHLEGDECLKRVVGTLSLCVRRATDLLARYGGEEFAIILPESDADSALRVADTIHRELQRAAIPHEDSPVSRSVTVSIGIACCVPGVDMHSDSLLALADEALYTAKHQGRNRSACAGQDA